MKNKSKMRLPPESLMFGDVGIVFIFRQPQKAKSLVRVSVVMGGSLGR